MPRLQRVEPTVTGQQNELDSYPYRPAHPPWWPGDERGYSEYHRRRYTLTSRTTPFDRWKIRTTGVNVCRQLAGARNLGRAAWEREHGADPDDWPLAHPPAVLWIPYIAHAACLRCWWLGDSSADAGQAASSARRHAAAFLESGGAGLDLLLKPLPVWHRALDADVDAPRWAG